MATKIIPVTDLRRAARELLEEVEASGGPIYITHRSRPQGVLIGYESFEALMTRLRDLEALLAERGAEPSAQATSSSRFSQSARGFTHRLLKHNRSLFEELAGR